MSGRLKNKAQRKVSLAVEVYRTRQRSSLFVWKRVNECACKWPRPYPHVKKATFVDYNIVKQTFSVCFKTSFFGLKQ